MHFSFSRFYLPIVITLSIITTVLWLFVFSQSLLRSESVSATSVTESELSTIVIDPGHGGIDPGTASADGLQEKTVNLLIAQHLKPLFQATGYSVVLTRYDDTDLSSPDQNVAKRKTQDLKNRLAVFEQTSDSLVLSIHQNHYSSESSHGAQMFYGTSHPLSMSLAQSLQNRIVSSLQPDNTRQIKPIDSSVYIIHHTTRPAVLCECGFLSNPDDATNLADPDYCGRLAFAIFSGVLEFLEEHQSK